MTAIWFAIGSIFAFLFGFCLRDLVDNIRLVDDLPPNFRFQDAKDQERTS